MHMEKKEAPIVIDGYEAADALAGKKAESAFIDIEREKYFERGGTIKVIVPPYNSDDPKYYHADGFVPGEGAVQLSPDAKDTMVRKPRPPKKYGKG